MDKLAILAEAPPWEWPEDTDTLVLETLLNNQIGEDARLVAAGMAGDYTIVNDEIFDILLSIVGDPEETDKMRGNAAISLGPALEHGDIDEFDDPDDCPISESTFLAAQESLHTLYMDSAIPKVVRRYILEASIRAPQDWHQDAVRAAYASGDADFMLTAVFSMQWVRGFDDQILESLDSDNDLVHYHAVCAAGNWELKAAWPHVKNIVVSERADKDLLLAAIEAAVSIRPLEAGEILADLVDIDDEDIEDAIYEALTMAGHLSGEIPDDEEDELLN